MVRISRADLSIGRPTVGRVRASDSLRALGDDGSCHDAAERHAHDRDLPRHRRRRHAWQETGGACQLPCCRLRHCMASVRHDYRRAPSACRADAGHGARKPQQRRFAFDPRRPLPICSFEARLPDKVPRTDELFSFPVVERKARSVPDGHGAGFLVSSLLLGADASHVRRWAHEHHVDGRHHGSYSFGKDIALSKTARIRFGCRSDCFRLRFFDWGMR